MDVEVSNTIPTIVENEEHFATGTESGEILEDGKMLPPPIKNFRSREELLDYVHDFSFTQGYATTIRDSEKEKYVTIGCDRGGTYRNRMNTTFEERKKKSSTRLIDCPFRIKGVKLVDNSWIVRIKNGNHNHEASKDMSGHPSFRRCSVEEIKKIKEMSMSGTQPKQILSSLRQANPQFKAISRTIYNVKAKIRKETLGGRAPIDVLFEDLSKGGFIHNVKTDAESRLCHLFFAHPKSITLSRSYPTVFLMDCTYQTNTYHMPVLDIIGVSSFNTSFYSSFAFLSKEEEGDYVWALNCFKNMLEVEGPSVIVTDRELALMNAIKVVFPNTKNLICSWHIEMNIKKHCKEYFEEEEDWNAFRFWWTSIVQSDSESTFEKSWREFETIYKDKVVAISYIKKTWLPLREHFIKAWTDAYLHFGNRVTSRAEGSHATLKSYVQVSTGDLLTTSRKMYLAVENNFREIQTQLASEKITLPHGIRVPYFKELAYHVSKYALYKLLEQYKLAVSNSPLNTCKGQFTSTMGLPCAHRMRALSNDVLHLSEIHSQWRLDIRSFEDSNTVIDIGHDKLKPLFEELEKNYQQWPITQQIAAQTQLSQIINSSAPIVFDPVVKSRRGRPSKSKATKSLSSTRRDPSSFELIENKKNCTICKLPGHNRRSCKKRVKDAGVQEQIASAERSPLSSLDLNSMPNNNNAKTIVAIDITKGPRSCMTQSPYGQEIGSASERYKSTPMQQHPRNIYQNLMYDQHMYHHVAEQEVYEHGSVYPMDTSSFYSSNAGLAHGSRNSLMQISSTNRNNDQPSDVHSLQKLPQISSHRLDFMDPPSTNNFFM